MIPNILTTVRLALVPVFAYLILAKENFTLAAIIFVLSGITDIVDGYIARHYNMISNFGKVYDPFVDKLMQLTAVVCLAVAGIIPFWVITVALLKEVTMIILGGILYLKKIVVYSHWYGKAATVVFYAIIFTFILWRNITPVWATIFIIIMIGVMVFSGIAYLIDIIKNYDVKRVPAEEK
ncbi:MAG: CDP-alcohol phosphatidyltransferase family protein [Clostridia bacterium]|nr:CDP-alcohol phosphatidyltransferase family protein [Clostridia bacterium]